MSKTEKYLLLGVVLFYLYHESTFAGSATQSSAAFIAGGGNSNWTVNMPYLPPMQGATSAVTYK